MSKPPNYNAAHALDRAARAHPHRVSIHYGERTWTVIEAALETRRLAQLLASSGVAAGDRVALISHNSPYHMLLHVACARLGAIFVPISYRFSRFELQQLLDFAAPRVVVVEPEIAEGGIFTSLGTVTNFVIDDDEKAPPFTASLNLGYFALSAAAQAFDGKFVTDTTGGLTSLNSREYPSGAAAILFTSGSTGRPKAVCLTHEQLWWASRNFREGFEYSNLDVELVVAPLTHIGGFNGTTLDLFTHGGTIVIVRDFDATEVLYRLEQHQVGIMFGVPTMYEALVNDSSFAATDLSAFRLPLLGGAPVSPALLDKLEAAGLAPLNVWGMTEAAASGCYLPAELLATHRGSIGRPFAHVEARITDVSTGEDADTGELIIRGPNVVSEYWHDADLGRRVFRAGWMHTGDIVRQDKDGYLWIVGRLNNQINSGGEKIIPEEVTAVLRQHPLVADCAIVGIPDTKWGERVAAAVVLEAQSARDSRGSAGLAAASQAADDHTDNRAVAGEEQVQARIDTFDGAVSLEEVQEFCARYLARFKIPRVLVVVEKLPTNANGKTDMAAVAKLIIETMESHNA